MHSCVLPLACYSSTKGRALASTCAWVSRYLSGCAHLHLVAWSRQSRPVVPCPASCLLHAHSGQRNCYGQHYQHGIIQVWLYGTGAGRARGVLPELRPQGGLWGRPPGPQPHLCKGARGDARPRGEPPKRRRWGPLPASAHSFGTAHGAAVDRHVTCERQLLRQSCSKAPSTEGGCHVKKLQPSVREAISGVAKQQVNAIKSEDGLPGAAPDATGAGAHATLMRQFVKPYT